MRIVGGIASALLLTFVVMLDYTPRTQFVGGYDNGLITRSVLCSCALVSVGGARNILENIFFASVNGNGIIGAGVRDTLESVYENFVFDY